MKKQFGELSQFITGKRDVELFRSSDLNNTAIYFTDLDLNDDDDDDDDKYSERDMKKAFFELLRFELDGGDHQIYIRFPNTDYFVEMLGGGMGSGRGDMKNADGKNVWEDKNAAPFNIYSHGKNLIILFGRSDWTHEFNFMTKVASYDKGNQFDHPYPNETFLNYEEIKEALSLKFLKLPENIRRIEYIYKTKGVEQYFVIDYPAYNFKYNTQRFRIIESNNEVKEYKIKSYQRYKDGGTTTIMVVDEHGTEHRFFSPQQMFNTGEKLTPKFDDVELIGVNFIKKQEIIKLLGIELEPKEEGEDSNDTDTEI